MELHFKMEMTKELSVQVVLVADNCWKLTTVEF
jgi:hypothetical protein